MRLKQLWKYKYLYLFLFPAIIYYFTFAYIPMYGITLGFKEFQFNKSIWEMPWAGMQYFDQFINYYKFWDLIRNTLFISFLKLLFGFPAALGLALLLNEIRSRWFKRMIQTVSYLPFFVSWVVVMTLFSKILSPNAGPINELKTKWFGGDPIFFIGDPSWFHSIVVLSDVWKHVGWNTIIFLAAISAINPELYEAASMDGARRFQRMWYITLPSIRPIIGIMLILSMGGLMSAGYEQIYLMRQPSNLAVSEILDTYIIHMGLRQGYYSLATVAGMFQGVVSLVIIFAANTISRRASGVSLW